jgi:DNA-binding MarR family transcriptional regulator
MSAAKAAVRTDGLQAAGDALRALVGAARRMRGRETHRHDQLSYAQLGLLFAFADAEELSSRDLAQNADLTPATVNQMLDGLEAAGLITRRRADHDRRVVLTSLTGRGATLVAERRAQIEPRWRAALSEFDDDELLLAARVMDQIAQFYDDLLQEP